MRILLVGSRSFGKRALGGPTSAFEGLFHGLTGTGVKVVLYPQKAERKIIAYLRLFFLLLKKWDIINVHLDNNFGCLVGLMRFRSSKTILTVHGYNKVERKKSWYNSIMHSLQVKYLFKNRIYVSNLIKNNIEKMDYLLEGAVIHNGVDIVRIHRSILDQSARMERFIFSLCGYSETKGIDFLLDALRSCDKNVRFIIAGFYKNDYDFTKISPELINKGEFRGEMQFKEVLKCYLSSHIYIQPSMYESFGLPVLEAMYLGIPVIVSKGAGVSELLTNDVDSIIVDYDDVDGMKGAIEKLLEDQDYYEWLALNGQETATRQSWANVSKKYLSVYRSCRQMTE